MIFPNRISVYDNRWDGGLRVCSTGEEEPRAEYIRADLLEELCNATEELLFVIKVHGFAGPKVDAVQAALAAMEG